MAVSNKYVKGMEKVVIIINAEVNQEGKFISASPVTQRMVEALKQNIAIISPQIKIEVVSAVMLASKQSKTNKRDSQTIYCPLTIQLPEYLNLPTQKIYSACKDIVGRRRWVEQNLGFKTSVGDSWLGHLWLPVVLTADEAIYAEVIGEGEIPNSYEQPVTIPNRQLKSLYKLADGLLDALSAPPAVYLIQFSLYKGEIVFDRLWPFPAAPALITLKTQKPDLFACHWSCLINEPIADLKLSKAMTM